jgi:transposase-like protein
MFVRRKDAEREEARRLRGELGWSVARIARELGVAKSSVSVWVRDLAASPTRTAPERPPGALPTRRLLVWRSGQLRRCSRCRYELPLECFNRLGDGRQWYCRPCFAAYFRARGDLHRNQSKAAKRARVRLLRAHVLQYLLDRPCVDCGEWDPVVLEFDYVGEKTAGVAALVAAGVKLEVLNEEISRCEVVCVNCHRRRSARRRQSRHADPPGGSKRPYPSAGRAQRGASRSHSPPERVRGLRRARPACARLRSRRSQTGERHGAREVGLEPRGDRFRDRAMRDSLCELPSKDHRTAGRSLPIPRPKLFDAPVAQW